MMVVRRRRTDFSITVSFGSVMSARTIVGYRTLTSLSLREQKNFSVGLEGDGAIVVELQPIFPTDAIVLASVGPERPDAICRIELRTQSNATLKSRNPRRTRPACQSRISDGREDSEMYYATRRPILTRVCQKVASLALQRHALPTAGSASATAA